MTSHREREKLYTLSSPAMAHKQSDEFHGDFLFSDCDNDEIKSDDEIVPTYSGSVQPYQFEPECSSDSEDSEESDWETQDDASSTLGDRRQEDMFW